MTVTNAWLNSWPPEFSAGTSYDVFEVGPRYEAIKRREGARRDRETHVPHVLAKRLERVVHVRCGPTTMREISAARP
jgi:hypothetical protein